MSTTVLLLLSGILIGTGITLVWFDLHRKRRDTFVVRRDAGTATGPEPEVEITIQPRQAAAPQPQASRARVEPSAPPVAAAAAPKTDKSVSQLLELWASLQPAIGAAVDEVNAVLARAGVGIGPAGEPSWSLNRDYGVHRRVLIAGESKAWLRLEVGADRRLHASLKAHNEDMAAINTSSSLPVLGLNTGRTADLLSEVLKPAASFAMLMASGNAEERAGEMGWKPVEAVVTAALQAANGALAQAGARFVPLGAASWNEEAKRHRLTVSVEVLNQATARMHIDRIGPEMEVAVGVPDARLVDLGRRDRVPVQGMTTHMLAELIASCAWPAIAHAREARGRTGINATK